MKNMTDKRWFRLRTKLQESFGTVRAAAAHFECSTQALRCLIDGNCPKLAGRVIAYYGVENMQDLFAEPAAVATL